MTEGKQVVDAFDDLRRDIIFFLTSLRHSLDRPLRVSSKISKEGRERHTHNLLLVEEARIRFNSYARYRSELSDQEWVDARGELRASVDKIMNVLRESESIYYNTLFVAGPISSRERGGASEFVRQFFDRERRHSVGEALEIFRRFIEQAMSAPARQLSLNLENLRRIVPEQQIAPVQFAVVKGQIRVIEGNPRTIKADRKNIASALEHIRESGKGVIEALHNSNCDRRLLESIRELHTQILENGNIVKIGLTNLACSAVGGQFQKELPDAIFGMLISYNASISMYAAQFPDWLQFAERVARVDLTDDDMAEANAAADQVIAALESKPELADPQVPKTISFVQDLLQNPAAASKRAVFALITTVENLISSILNYTFELLQKTAEKTIDNLSGAAAKIIVGLLGIALVGAVRMGEPAAHAGAPWVKQAAEFILKQVDKAAD